MSFDELAGKKPFSFSVGAFAVARFMAIFKWVFVLRNFLLETAKLAVQKHYLKGFTSTSIGKRDNFFPHLGQFPPY